MNHLEIDFFFKMRFENAEKFFFKSQANVCFLENVKF
jgi:hypothetical protein